MKKITIFALNLSSGGIEKYISILCKMLEDDYQIEIISTYKIEQKSPFNFSKKIQIKYLTNDYIERISIKELYKDKKYIKIIKEIIRRKKLKKKALKLNIKEIKKLNSNYVITTREYHSKLVNKYLKNKNIVKIATEHNYHNNDNKYINKLIKSITSFDYFICCTDELKTFYMDKVTGPQVIMIPHAIDIENENISKINNKQVISVGRLSPEKGFIDLIDTFKYVIEKDNLIKLIICGKGEQEHILKNKIKELKLENNIKMLGFITGEDLEKLYINSSLYVMPSISEAFGLVLLEAMHFGLPCIAFKRASGARELLKDNTGILVENNKKEMANKIIEILNNKELLKQYQIKSLEKVKKYELSVIYKEWKQILK